MPDDDHAAIVVLLAHCHRARRPAAGSPRTASWYSRSQHQFADSSGRTREPTAKVVERGLDRTSDGALIGAVRAARPRSPRCELASALRGQQGVYRGRPAADGPADRLAICRTVVTLPLSVAPSAIIGTAQPCCPYQRHGYRRPQQPARYAQSNHQPDLSSLGRRSPTGLMNFHVRSSGAALSSRAPQCRSCHRTMHKLADREGFPHRNTRAPSFPAT